MHGTRLRARAARAARAVCLAALLGTALAPAAAQTVAARAVGKVLAELPEPFSAVSDVRELSDGRLVVLDVKDNVLRLVSADLATVQPIGREGSGPTEYRRITQLLPRRGDSTLGYDVMNARFLVIDNKGAATSVLSLRDAAGGLPVGPMAVRGYDPMGRLLFQGMKLSMGPNGPALSDTAPLLRLDPARKRVDTLSAVRIGSPGMKMSGDVQKGSGALRLTIPAYPVVDEWGMLPDGRVVVFRGADYRMEFISTTGQVTSKGPVPYTRVRVTDADKVALRKTQQEMQKEIARAMTGARAAAPAGKSAPKMPSMQVDEPTEWPEYKPAFGQTSLKIAPNGELWMARLGAAGHEAQHWDVFTSTGELRLRAELPPKTKLVGIGASYLYTVRIDDDELQYLERRARP